VAKLLNAGIWSLPIIKSIATQRQIWRETIPLAGVDKKGKSRSRRGSRPAGNKARRFSLRQLLKRLFILLVVIGLVPIVLTLIYIPASVHPVSTLMVKNWLVGSDVHRKWVPLEDISPFVYQSIVSSEDGQFCFHNGVDWAAVNLVVDDLIEGERPRGASTIPMQTVKNLFLWPNRSYVRKVLEVPLALYADLVWSKHRMMEIYLNIAEWGPGRYGIEAAARHHFKKSAKQLTRRQAALLAVTLPNPIARNPRKPGRGMGRLARLVEKRAKQSGAYVKCLR